MVFEKSLQVCSGVSSGGGSHAGKMNSHKTLFFNLSLLFHRPQQLWFDTVFFPKALQMLGACWALHNTGRAAGPGASLRPTGATSASRGAPSHGTTHHHLAEGMGFPTANTSRDCSASALLYQRSISYTGDPQCWWAVSFQGLCKEQRKHDQNREAL